MHFTWLWATVGGWATPWKNMIVGCDFHSSFRIEHDWYVTPPSSLAMWKSLWMQFLLIQVLQTCNFLPLNPMEKHAFFSWIKNPTKIPWTNPPAPVENPRSALLPPTALQAVPRGSNTYLATFAIESLGWELWQTSIRLLGVVAFMNYQYGYMDLYGAYVFIYLYTCNDLYVTWSYRQTIYTVVW